MPAHSLGFTLPLLIWVPAPTKQSSSRSQQPCLHGCLFSTLCINPGSKLSTVADSHKTKKKKKKTLPQRICTRWGFYWRSAVMRDAYRTALQILYILILDPYFSWRVFLVTLSINLRSGCMTPLFPPGLPGLLLLRKKRKSSVFAESFPLLLSPPLGLDSGNTQSVCIPCSICSRLHAFQLPLGLVRGDTVSALLTPLIGSMPPFSKCRRGQWQRRL